MWVRTSEDAVTNLETGHVLDVSYVDDERAQRSWNVGSYYPAPGRRRVVLGDRYESAEEARDALDALLTEWDVKPTRVKPSKAVKEEEDAKADEEDRGENVGKTPVPTKVSDGSQHR